MIKIYFTLTLALLLACKDTKINNDAIASVAKTQEQIETENDEKKARMRIAEIGNMSPISTLLDQDSASISTEEFKGKIVVIDFWATWCSPCIDEAPKFKALEKQYENDKIEFITVSIDDEFTYWKAYILENDWQTNNYWFGMKETDPFFAYMYSEMEFRGETKTVVGLPKYVILSPTGKIAHNQAPKPSDPNLEEEIKLMLKKHAS